MMKQTYLTRLSRLEMRPGSAGRGRVLVAVEDSHGNFTTLDGEPWDESLVGPQDAVVWLWYPGGDA